MWYIHKTDYYWVLTRKEILTETTTWMNPEDTISEISQSQKNQYDISSAAQSCPTLCNLMDCSTPGFPVHHQLLELPQTHVHSLNDAIQPSHPLLSSSPPVFYVSRHQGLFQWDSSSHQVAKVLEFPSNEYSGLISFRKDWFDLLVVQGTIKNLLQHHSSKHQFFSAQLSL